MAKARHGGVDYLFALLTGYVDSPAGKDLLPVSIELWFWHILLAMIP